MSFRTDKQDFVLYTYDSARDGQIAVGTITSPFMNVSGFSEVVVSLLFAQTTGATVVTLDYSVDGVNVAVSTAALTGTVDVPQKLTLAYPFMRVKIVQTTAATTNARVSVKNS